MPRVVCVISRGISVIVGHALAYNGNMLELKIRKTRVRLNFSFFAVVALFLTLDNTSFGIAALAACGIHEFSHLLVMTICAIPAEVVTFYGAGIRITSPQTENAKPVVRTLILGAGCAANFIAAALYSLSGNDAAAAINLLTGVFNLLPIGELDGAALLKTVLISKCRPESVDKVLRAVRRLTVLLLVGAVLLTGRSISFTLVTTVVYIIAVSLDR